MCFFDSPKVQKPKPPPKPVSPDDPIITARTEEEQRRRQGAVKRNNPILTGGRGAYPTGLQPQMLMRA